ncbi:MAG TPA: type II secretion system F family protein [Gammaproteobacteria bacterium]
MALYRYSARNHNGEAISGKIDAGSADAVATQLIHSGITPIEITEVQQKGDSLAQLRGLLESRKPGLDELILFCRQMHTLSRAGVPLIRAINGLAETTANRRLAEAIQRVKQNLEGGHDLSMALSMESEIFNNLIISIVRVGETTGRLDDAFLQLAEYLEMERDTRDRIKTALRYPLFVLIAIAIAIGVINVLVIPAFANVFARMDADLPWQTQLLMSLSQFSVAYWHYITAGLLFGGLALRRYISAGEGKFKWDKYKLGLPLVGSLVMRSTLARFTRSFAMAFKSGVPLIQALTVTARAVDNDYVADRILSMRNGVERGESLTRTAAATDLFPPLVLQMFAVGEETGSIDTMMEDVASYYEREVDYELKNLSSAIEPVLIIAIGIMVLIVALGVFLPMWDMSQLARR